MKITVHRPACSELPAALAREWLDTNGIGGYASGTIANCHTRKYHGLLVSALAQPSGRFVLLSQLEDWLEVGERSYPLVTRQYGDAFAPDGHSGLLRFENDPVPTFVYECGEATVTRQVMMVHGADTVLVRYELTGQAPGAVLCFRPLLAYRDIHHVTHENPVLDPTATPLPDGLSIRPYAGLPELQIRAGVDGCFTPEPLWYRNATYARDAERGFEHSEDLFSPGLFRVPLGPRQAVVVAASLAPLAEGGAKLWQAEKAWRTREAKTLGRRAAGRVTGSDREELLQALLRAAEHHLIELAGVGPAIHAGYHWFGPWGRDTLIALPGLTLATGRLDLAERILRPTAAMETRGLLPNFVNPDGTGAYTAVDPSLWFFWAVQQYLAAGGRAEVVRHDYWPTMLSVLQHYREGTDNRILMDTDGLLRAGMPGSTVTWMDAQIGGRPVVPRWGYMVEINALWYNALRFALDLAHRFDEYVPDLDPAFCDRVRDAFVRRFWDPGLGLLVDTANEYFVEACVRPNQILAAALPYSPLAPDQLRSVVEVVRQELFTPCGLRTLSPHDVRYRPTCQGHHGIRDLAYHQGSVWPWLLAPFAEAAFRAYGRTPETQALFAPTVTAFREHLQVAGVGSVSEIFDGDPPHTPRGAISQAWNLGELIRLLLMLG